MTHRKLGISVGLVLLFTAAAATSVRPQEPSRAHSRLKATAGIEFVTMLDALSLTSWLSAYMPFYAVSVEREWSGFPRHDLRASFSYSQVDSFRASGVELEDGEYALSQATGVIAYRTFWNLGRLFALSHGVALEPEYVVFDREVAEDDRLVQKDLHVNVLTLLGFSMSAWDRLDLGLEAELGVGLPVYGTLDYPGVLNERTRTLILHGGGSARAGVRLGQWRLGVLYHTRLRYLGTTKADDSAILRNFWLHHSDRVALELEARL